MTVGPATGLTEALRFLETLQRPDLSDVLSQESKRIVKVAQVYPPEHPGQRYVRTFNLRDNWNPIPPARVGGGWAAGAENDTSYASDVMGDTQAFIHQNRWRTDDAIAEAEEPNVASAIEDWFDDTFGGA